MSRDLNRDVLSGSLAAQVYRLPPLPPTPPALDDPMAWSCGDGSDALKKALQMARVGA